MLASLHLVRHGEVHNPDGLVYADLPGFALSDLGIAQARAAAAHLATRPISALLTSPLQRAVETALPISAALGVDPKADDRLTEWTLAQHWAGVAWDELPTVHPGELEAYLSDPAALAFASERIAEVADRMGRVVVALGEEHPGGEAVLVSHQDPLQALRLTLRGDPLDSLHEDKPGHGCVITLDADDARWQEADNWCPPMPSAPFPPITAPP